jgi:hypothetical protein
MVSCGSQKPSNDFKKVILSPNYTAKSGTIIYDYKKVKAYFIDKKLDVQKVKNSEIKRLISNPNSIILLDQSLWVYSSLDSFNLLSCRNDKLFIINKKQLVHNRFQLIPIENEHFYKVQRKYNDSIERLMMCPIKNN